MASKHVRTHTNKSNRASAKDLTDRKVVYKSVLDNPFTVSWPKVPTNIQNAVLSQLVATLDGVAQYHAQRQQMSRKRKRAQNDSSRTKPRSSTGIHLGNKDSERTDEVFPLSDTMDISIPEAQDKEVGPVTIEMAPHAPDILQHVTCGINEVTRTLEELASSLRRTSLSLSSPAQDVPQGNAGSQLILVCVGDVNPPLLIEHIPNLVASCNSARRQPADGCTWLIPLPAGAETTLAGAMGLRRVSALLLSSSATAFESLRHFLSTVTVLRASWLGPTVALRRQTLLPTHIKQLRTTAPKDMKAAKERRVKGRAEAKKRKKDKQSAAKGKALIPALDIQIEQHCLP